MEFIKENFELNKKGMIYDFLEDSSSSKFYNELFSETHSGSNQPELYESAKQKAMEDPSDSQTMEFITNFLVANLDENAVVIELGGGIYQQRSANAYKKFKNYFPLDISFSSIQRYSEKFNKIGFVGDAKRLPFKDKSIDCIFTHTFLEHPLNPQEVLTEINRVLKTGGIVVHNDAWFCRWWQRRGIIGLKRFSNMTLPEKLFWFRVKISEFPLFRIPPIIIRRILRSFIPKENSNLALKYKKLNPNYSLHLGCDEDAASSIDPIDVVLFYESRGFKLIKELSYTQRLFYPNKFIMLRKIK